ncbi:MAG: hypothetical protein NXH72_06040 [Hyphomonadaceae bacterium]|nr:hypothetical protein [Hyphomonadaceae bacterium]
MQRFALFARQVHVAGQAPVWFAIGMLIGCVWYFSVNYEPDLWVVSVAFFALLISTRYAKQRFRSAVSGVVLILFCGIAAGAASGGLASARVQTVTIVKETGPVRLEGWIQNALPGERGLRLLIRVHAIDGVAASQQPAFVRVTHRSQLRTEPGRFVTCWVVLRPPPKPVISRLCVRPAGLVCRLGRGRLCSGAMPWWCDGGARGTRRGDESRNRGPAATIGAPCPRRGGRPRRRVCRRFGVR